MSCYWVVDYEEFFLNASAKSGAQSVIRIKFLFTLVFTGFRFGERFGRNITVNQSDCFSMNCLAFLLT
jgi:hypothetical protein